MNAGAGRVKGFIEWHAFDALQTVVEERVGLILDQSGDLAFGGATMRRIVLEAPVLGRVVRGRDHDSVCQTARSSAIVFEDRMRDGGRGSVFIPGHPDRDSVGRENFERRREGGLRERMRVDTDQQRAVDTRAPAITADRLGDGEDMPFVEGPVQGRTAVARGAEGYSLRGDARVGTVAVVIGDEARRINEAAGRGRFTGKGADGHSEFL